MADRSSGSTNGDGGLSQDLHTDRLKQEVQDLLMVLGERAIGSLSDRVSGVTERLSDIAPDGSGVVAALTGGKSPVGALLGGGLSSVKDKVKDALTGGDGGGGGDKGSKIKVTNIVEQIDVGVPVSTAYDYWTRFEDFPGFMKKVEDVEQGETEAELEWKAQVLWSHRKWQSTILEQVPDEMIVWESKAEKGHVDGAVTFHELTPNLTRILLVLQYHPQGFFEQTGNIWRAQGRRVRLEL
ncbi:SRPBCC family protein, partial [Streptomyces sp. NPDC047108]|uniref:SRPBCC family protein n=1 Tax=Streptomyces sp. NPDC047108 TaxID=3155025 RepID=UPI0033DCFF87